jgi:hypothetical protein
LKRHCDRSDGSCESGVGGLNTFAIFSQTVFQGAAM